MLRILFCTTLFQLVTTTSAPYVVCASISTASRLI